jgi:predicted phage baseplate assembly protein
LEPEVPLIAPNLDDRRYDDILAQAKALIPRYAPAWTDHNPSDPGITLLELFAWMTEMIIYRLNQVPERNFIKFLEMVGIKARPAQPAQAELTFTVARPDIPFVIVPKSAQVATADPGGNPPLVFETDEALIALGAQLNAVQSFDGFAYSVETTKNNAAGQWFFPFGPHAREGSALLLGFDSPAPFTDQQVHLAVHIQTQGLTPEGSHCDLDLNTQPLASDIQWEYWDTTDWERISLDKDETRSFARSGHIYFPGPGSALPKAKVGDVKDPLYWIRARLVRNGYDATPRIASVLTNTVRATQAETVRDEILGGSDGRPGQSFTLENAPVLDGSQRLEVDEGLGFQVWQEVEDFFASGPDNPHYTLDRSTGVIQFPTLKGRIPAANPANPDANIVARFYRFGGGKAGNAGAKTIAQLQSFVEGISDVTNFESAVGGSDEETVDEAKLRAPHDIQAKNRAVTAEDFETLAIETPGVRIRRAKALPLTHPKFPGTPIPGVVTVIVVPDSDAANPTPGEATLRIVCAHLNLHRLLASELFVVPPVYRKIRIEADVVVRPDADLAVVKHAVEDGITNFFHPLTGGDDGTGWEFGGEIFFSEVSRLIVQTPGVARIGNNQLVIWIDGVCQPFCQDVPICPGELLFSEGHDIRVSYALR